MRTVLIVEDDHETRVALREAFEVNGFRVHTAGNGIDGLALLQAIPSPFVVLLDQNMPVMSGDEFLRRRLRIPELVGVPVIVMSAVADRSSALGAADFVAKPLDVHALVRKVQGFFPGDPPAATPTACAGAGGRAEGEEPFARFSLSWRFQGVLA